MGRPMQSSDPRISVQGFLWNHSTEKIGKWLEQDCWSFTKSITGLIFAFGPWFLIKTVTTDPKKYERVTMVCSVIYVTTEGRTLCLGIQRHVCKCRRETFGFCPSVQCCLLRPNKRLSLQRSKRTLSVFQLYNIILLGWRTIFLMTRSSSSSFFSSSCIFWRLMASFLCCQISFSCSTILFSWHPWQGPGPYILMPQQYHPASTSSPEIHFWGVLRWEFEIKCLFRNLSLASFLFCPVDGSQNPPQMLPLPSMKTCPELLYWLWLGSNQKGSSLNMQILDHPCWAVWLKPMCFKSNTPKWWIIEYPFPWLRTN